jgi:hypothetical protein
MKCDRLLLAFAICSFAGAAANAQQFAVPWFSIDGGAGASAGGVYAVAGAIDQVDTAAMSGGEYTLQGAFWSIVALEAGTVPVLRLTTDTGHVAISWAGPALDFVLQESSALGPSANWRDVGAPVIVNGLENTVIQPIARSGRFYRLRHP